MSSEQIATALDRLQRELTALLEDKRLLQAERDRRMTAPPRNGTTRIWSTD
jgi:hypothetical protein